MEEKKYYAHSANAKGDWQPLKDYLQNVAALAKKFAEEARPATRNSPELRRNKL